ncbi:MAG: ribosomal protein [Paenibacillaceae bacterium]|jgi:small subunit ribosomal protein S1|nr:ribosomal protein [Paenibacillaceae bacterium]
MTEEIKVKESEEKSQAAEQQAETQADAADQAQESEAAVDQHEQLTGMTKLKKGDIVKGTIVKVDNDQAYVNIGYKYDGVIPIRELSNLQIENAASAVQVDQEVELKVVTIDDEKEKLILSKRLVDGEKAWDELQQKMDSGEIIEATVADVVKGGLVVDVGLRGFVPASMVERHFVEDFSDYKGRGLRLKVKELDREKNKVILSQKDVLDVEFEERKKEVISSLSVGQELDGTVQRLTPFGVFVDIGGIDGLVHISELAWHHVEKASDVVKEGDQVKVKVLKLDPDAERISLSIKATQEGPWDRVDKEFAIGSTVTGTVKRLVGFGAFVEIAPGVEGLVHISQISHSHIGTPHEVLKEGQEVSAKILDIDKANKRVSLSIKETLDAPAPSPRAEKGSRGGGEKYELDNQSLNLTLGERFGDKLSKFK